LIDYLALALTHALIVLALMRILRRDELDRENPQAEPLVEPDQPALRGGSRARRRRKGADDA
jgi:hypothetical protein